MIICTFSSNIHSSVVNRISQHWSWEEKINITSIRKGQEGTVCLLFLPPRGIQFENTQQLHFRFYALNFYQTFCTLWQLQLMCGIKAQLSTEWISKHCMNWCGKIKSFYRLCLDIDQINWTDRQLCRISSPAGIKMSYNAFRKKAGCGQHFFFFFVINKYLKFTYLFLKLG